MQRRILDLENLDGVLGEVERLHQGGYQKSGQWNLSQNLSHCGQVIEQTMDGFTFTAPWYYRLLRPLLKNMIFKQRTIRPGIKRLGNVMEPKPQPDEAGAVAEFKQIVERFKNHPGPLHSSPILGDLTEQQWHDFHTIHCSLHLGFLIPNE